MFVMSSWWGRGSENKYARVRDGVFSFSFSFIFIFLVVGVVHYLPGATLFDFRHVELQKAVEPCYELLSAGDQRQNPLVVSCVGDARACVGTP